MSKSTGGCREGIIKGKTLRYGAPSFQLWSQSHGDMLFWYNEKKGTHTVIDNDYLTGLLVKLLTNLLSNHCP